MKEFILLTQYYNGRTIMLRTDSILCAARSGDDARTYVADRESPDAEQDWEVKETPEEIYRMIYGEAQK